MEVLEYVIYGLSLIIAFMIGWVVPDIQKYIGNKLQNRRSVLDAYSKVIAEVRRAEAVMKYSEDPDAVEASDILRRIR
jgi:hypothetical protein